MPGPAHAPRHVPRVSAGGPELGAVVGGRCVARGHVAQLPQPRLGGEGHLVVGVAHKPGPGNMND